MLPSTIRCSINGILTFFVRLSAVTMTPTYSDENRLDSRKVSFSMQNSVLFENPLTSRFIRRTMNANV